MEKTIDIEIKKGTRRLAPFLHAAIRPLKQYSKCLEAEKLNKTLSLYSDLYHNEKDSRLRRHYRYCMRKAFGKITTRLLPASTIYNDSGVTEFVSRALGVPRELAK